MATLFRPTYTVKAKDGTRTKKQTLTWYAKWMREGKSYKVSLKTKNKAAAKRKLADIERNLDEGRHHGGSQENLASQTPIEEFVTAWESILRAKGGTEKNVQAKVAHVRKVVAQVEASTVSDLTADSVIVALSQMRTAPKGKPAHRFGVQTSNHHLTSCKQFLNWLADRGTVARNPLTGIKPGSVATDRRHERRDLPDEELLRLFTAARDGRTLRGISGPDRAMLYQVAVFTGLRASELASLTPESFRLAADPPVVVVEAGYSKRKRKDEQPLHANVLEELRPWLAGRATGERLWPGRWAIDSDGSYFLKNDLKTCGLPYRDSEGRVADFHALRHTFVTRLVKAGASPKEAQSLARHSTITLTMDRYAHVERSESAKALGRVPGIGIGKAKEGKSGVENGRPAP